MRIVTTLCIAVLMTAVNGGVLAFASNWDGSSAAPGSTQLAVEISAVASGTDQLNACCNDQDEASQARTNQTQTSCKAGSSDCGGPLPVAGALSGGTADLWAYVAGIAHRGYLSENQLRPPRI